MFFYKNTYFYWIYKKYRNIKHRKIIFFLWKYKIFLSGIRLGKKQLKIGLATVLSKFKVEVCEKTHKIYQKDKKPLFLLQPADGIYLKISKVSV